VISVSDAERAIFTKNGVHPVHVLGHAIRPSPTPQTFENREGLLFVGALRLGTPNVDSVIWLVEEILPLIHARLGTKVPVTIVGVCDSERVWKLASDTIRVTGAVEDLREYYNGARVFVAPTRYAAGIPHKIHETAAYGLPAVVTPLLASQLGWTDGCEISVAEDTEGFADRCVRLYQQKDEWGCLRKNALARVEKDCSVEVFKDRLARILGF
jgi:glycosyltransferase involved in cell wall biosynthesis